MTVRIPKSPAKTIAMDGIRKRIFALSSDTRPEQFPVPGVNEDLETDERREAEESFQRALCLRTWWRLSAQERLVIRKRVLNDNTYLGKNPASSMILYACLGEVRTMLEQERV